MVEREVRAGLEHEAFVDAAAVGHGEIFPLCGTVVKYIALAGAYIMYVRRSEVNQVDVVRAFGNGVDKQVIFHRFATIYHQITNAVSPYIHCALSAIFKAQFAAFVEGEYIFLVRAGGIERSFQNKPVIGINHEFVIVHHPAFAYISGCKADIVEFIAEVECDVGNHIIIPEIGLFIQDEALAELGTSHGESDVVRFARIDLSVNIASG